APRARPRWHAGSVQRRARGAAGSRGAAAPRRRKRLMGVFAIGDLHGCPEELEVLLQSLGAGPADTLVFLGDYVDRGPRVRTLVERLLRLRHEGPTTVFLRGNHEDMLLAYLGLPGRHASAY